MNGDRWLSRPAVLWALHDAEGVPAHLLAALIAVAAYADQDGRAAFPSSATVARVTRKSERNARKDLAALARLGLLLPGDMAAAAKIPANRRPAVYDLPMPQVIHRGVADDRSQATPRDGQGGRTGPLGGSHRTARGVAQDTQIVLKRSGTSPARVREASAVAVRAVFPSATDDEIKIITEDRKGRGARNPAAVIAAEARDGTLRLPCDAGGESRHSADCRRGNGAGCTQGWCKCRCHIPAAGGSA